MCTTQIRSLKTYIANGAVSTIPGHEHFSRYFFIFLFHIGSILWHWWVVGVNAEEITPNKHDNTANNNHSVDVRGGVSNQTETKHTVNFISFARKGTQQAIKPQGSAKGPNRPSNHRVVQQAIKPQGSAKAPNRPSNHRVVQRDPTVHCSDKAYANT